MHLKSIILLVAVFILSCGKGKFTNQGDSGSIEETLNPSENEGEITTTESASLALGSKLKFKKQKLLEQEIMTSLSLSQNQICQELESLNCINEAHHLTLGGVDAYDKNIWENKNSFLETTPIVVERIVWSACEKRVALDLESGESKIFSKGSVSDSSHVGLMVSNLYQNILARDASENEIAAAKEFASNLEKNGGTYDDWARLSCFSLMTSVEFLFY